MDLPTWSVGSLPANVPLTLSNPTRHLYRGPAGTRLDLSCRSPYPAPHHRVTGWRPVTGVSSVSPCHSSVLSLAAWVRPSWVWPPCQVGPVTTWRVPVVPSTGSGAMLLIAPG